MAEVEVHPIQVHHYQGPPARVPKVVSMRAYEVYSRLHGEQEALVTGGCRGGFEVGELIAFLYARSFPEPEWPQRFQEACAGMEL